MKQIEILFWRFVRWLIIRGYGERCEVSDLVENATMYKIPQDVFHSGRCSCCRAWEIIDWIDEHIDLIKMF